VGTISYVSGVSDTPLLGKTIGLAVKEAAARFGDRLAVTSLFQATQLTYAGLDRLTSQVAASLMALGVKPGDRVAIWSANRWEWLAAHHGAVRIGAILTPINPAFRADELKYILQDAGISVLFASPAFRTYSYIAAIEEVRAEAAVLRSVVLFGGESPGMMGWSEFLAAGDAVPEKDLQAAAGAADFDAPCNIQYTSGTTGRPKGALLTHHNVLNNGFFSGQRLRLSERDIICVPVPFFHCFGNVVGALAAAAYGCELVLPGESFEPLATLEAVQARRCTVLYGVPMMFIAMLGHPELGRFDLRSLRTGIMGAAPCPMPVLKGAIERLHMRELTVAYGMTETSPVSFQTYTDDSPEVAVSTVGAIHPHLEAKIIGAGGETVPRGVPGELCVRGYSVMRGYWNREDATREAIDPGRWMHSGDLAVMDGNGYVQIVGRFKDTIIRGGENIYPREIEELFLTLPGVSEAYIFGVPDELYGEEAVAWVRLKPDSQITAAEIRELCKARIATYKIPKAIRFVSEFPATASGKAQKFRMREMEIEDRRAGKHGVL
jgi:fatty-acyl-CoA synthase